MNHLKEQWAEREHARAEAQMPEEIVTKKCLAVLAHYHDFQAEVEDARTGRWKVQVWVREGVKFTGHGPTMDAAVRSAIAKIPKHERKAEL